MMDPSTYGEEFSNLNGFPVFGEHVEDAVLQQVEGLTLLSWSGGDGMGGYGPYSRCQPVW